MERPSKDAYYLNIALAVSKRSTCMRRRYGCVIVKDDEIIATGYNGSPRGLQNCSDMCTCNRMDKPHNSGDYSDCHSVHAEQNAMLEAARKDMLGATMYLAGEEHKKLVINDNMIWEGWAQISNCAPCPICARMIVNAGISIVKNRIGELDIRGLV